MKTIRLLMLALPFSLALAPSLAAADSCDTTSVHPTCNCLQRYDPVCGMDGKTYGNSCEAGCACVDIAYSGECDDTCTKDCMGVGYAPVCSVDGETIGNECYAECLGVKIDHDGACGPTVSPWPHR